MTVDVDDLLNRWEEARDRGLSLAAEDLCRDHPDLLAEVRRQIAALEMFDAMSNTRTAPSAPPSEIPPTTDGPRYEPVRLHAKGGLGEVYLADDRELDRPVALKRMLRRAAADAGLRQRFLREASITARLQHPGIVPVYGVAIEPDGRPTYAMRFVEGQSLESAIETMARRMRADFDSLPFRSLLRRLIDACNAIAYAHSRGVIHRDIKPANIMLGEFGETLVVDWGLAKVVHSDSWGAARITLMGSGFQPTDDDDSNQEMTIAGAALGTPGYMSPEQACGDNATEASDIYSLGATLYEMLTGQLAFPGGWPTVREQIIRGDFPSPKQVNRDVPAALNAVCIKAMAAKPSDRYQKADQLAADLERWLAGDAVSARREPWPIRFARSARRHRTLVTAMMITVAMGTLALVTILASVEHERRATTKERDQAREQRRRTREALDDMLSAEAADWLTSKETVTPEQTAFLTKALRYYEEFAAEPAEGEDGPQLLAAALYRLSGIQMKLGKKQDAVATLRRVKTLVADICTRPDADLQMRLRLPATCDRLALILTTMGQISQAELEIRQSIDLYQQLIDAFPEESIQPLVAGSTCQLALALAHEGHFAAAEAEFRRSIDILEKFNKRFPDRLAEQIQLARTQCSFADMFVGIVPPENLMPQIQSAIDRMSALRKQQPDDANFQINLASAHHLMARVHLMLGQQKLAEADLRLALELAGTLIARNPGDAEYGKMAALLKGTLGMIHSAENPELGEREIRESLDQQISLLKRFPEYPGLRLEIANSRMSLAELFTTRQQLDKADIEYAQAIALFEEVVRECPSVAEQKTFLASCHFSRGMINVRRDRQADALRAFDATIEAVRDVPQEANRAGDPRKAVSDSYFQKAAAFKQLQRYDEALSAIDEAIRRASPPRKTYFQICRLLCLAILGRTDEALTVEALVADEKAPADDVYLAACIFAVCAAKSKDPDVTERLNGRAVGLIHRAIANGYNDIKSLKSDEELSTLRGRADFQLILRAIEALQKP